MRRSHRFRIPALAGLLGALAAGPAGAQVEESSTGPTCGRPQYVAQIDPNARRTTMTVSLNGRAIDLTDGSRVKRSVTPLMTAENRVQIRWTPISVGGNGKMYDTPTVIQMLHGSRATTVFQFDPSDYPNRREIAVKFKAPPAGNIACAPDAYLAKLDYSHEGPFEWTVAVNGSYHAYILGNATVDLRPFLVKGKNTVTLSWRVIGGSGKRNLGDRKVAQITSTVNGNTKSLLSFGFKNVVGSKGSRSVTITVP
ncbi:hypothetical protein [uncultured Deinococcus sp.]|uniref:hypothetical protein n=1 Tax=uncultured Deinococcus sp. TaxID=158789 RepID=UPI0025CD00AB|nr:hypothetical protein [uncultured Deinococcus sp.]